MRSETLTVYRVQDKPSGRSRGSDRSTADLLLPSIFDRIPGARNLFLLVATNIFKCEDCQMRIRKWASLKLMGIWWDRAQKGQRRVGHGLRSGVSDGMQTGEFEKRSVRHRGNWRCRSRKVVKK